MIDKKLAKALSYILYASLALIFIGVITFIFSGKGKILLEIGIYAILLSPLVEFIVMLVFGIKENKKKFVLISIWMTLVFLFSSLKFFLSH